jgi:hypothetical protein
VIPGGITALLFTISRRTIMAVNRISQAQPSAPEEASKHSEGKVARTIEEKTARLPSDLFLWAAGASIVGSLTLRCLGDKEGSNFVGLWAPTFLLLGMYNKIGKVAGSDRAHAS